MSISVRDIFNAFALWEQAELPTFAVERAANFKAFATFPTPDDVDIAANGPLHYPYTCHWCEKSSWLPVTVISTSGVPGAGSVEDQHTHVIICAFLFGTTTSAVHLLSGRDADWRDAYREAFLRNLQLRLPIIKPGAASSITAVMGDTTPLSLNMFEADNVGFQTPITVTLRFPMPTAPNGIA